jgi:hypothetical protein
MKEPPINPYQSPATSSTEPEQPERIDGRFRPPYKLYSVGAIVLATFLGTPMAGGAIMALNYKRLGRPTAALHTLGWTTLATAMILAAGMMVPDEVHIPSGALVVPQIFVMYYLAKSLQGPLIEAHRRNSGRLASSWGAAGIGILAAIIVVVAIVAVVVVLYA